LRKEYLSTLLSRYTSLIASKEFMTRFLEFTKRVLITHCEFDVIINGRKVNRSNNACYFIALFTPALIPPGTKFGLPPLWATVYAIHGSTIVKSAKALHYSKTIPKFQRF